MRASGVRRRDGERSRPQTVRGMLRSPPFGDPPSPELSSLDGDARKAPRLLSVPAGLGRRPAHSTELQAELESPWSLPPTFLDRTERVSPDERRRTTNNPTWAHTATPASLPSSRHSSGAPCWLPPSNAQSRGSGWPQCRTPPSVPARNAAHSRIAFFFCRPPWMGRARPRRRFGNPSIAAHPAWPGRLGESAGRSRASRRAYRL